MQQITINNVVLTSYQHEALKNDIKARHEEIAKALMQPDKHGGYICPVCSSGSHGKGTGISYKEGVYSCWACNCINTNGKTGGDIFKVIEAVKGKHTYIEQLQEAIEILGINVSNYGDESKTRRTATPIQAKPKEKEAPKVDFSSHYQEWALNLANSNEAKAYLAARGILWEDIKDITPPLGYCPNWRSPKAIEEGKNPPATKRLIIPTNNYHYLAREITGTIDPNYSKMHTGEKTAWGLQVLDTAQAGDVIFITEGEIDAISFVACGYKAIGMGGANTAADLAQKIKDKPCKFLIAGDNDEAGRKATNSLLNLTKGGKADIKDITSIISEKGEKDPNEVLGNSPEEFKRRVKKALCPHNARLFIEDSLKKAMIDFQDASDRKTGFLALDEQQGALYSGLYVLFAIPSLGKTTLAHQMADNMAAAGHDILFFSLEMSTFEMVCKSINREVYKISPHSIMSALKIRRGYKNEDIEQAKQVYSNGAAEHMNIIEGNFNYTAEDIAKEIRGHINRTGIRPIVFIDYLQLLKPAENKRQTTKEAMDSAITELKQISREFNITIVVISSVNRGNYASKASYEAIKESGGIEYTADVIWGLQLQAVHNLEEKDSNKAERVEALRKAKNERPRKIELICLKNRYGRASYTTKFDYYPDKDYFEDTGADDEKEEAKRANLKDLKKTFKGLK